MARTDQRSIPITLLVIAIALVAARAASYFAQKPEQDLVKWTSLDAVRSADQLVLLYFPGGDDDRLADEVFRNAELANDINTRFVPIRVDDDRLHQRFQVRTLPTILIVEPNGNERARMEGFRSREEFEKVLETVR